MSIDNPADIDSVLVLAALNSMEEALVAYDSDGCLIMCNQAFREMYQYSPEQTRPGVHFRELGKIDIQQGNVEVVVGNAEDYLERKASYRKALKGSFDIKLKDGRWIRTTDRPIPNGGFVSVQVDITDSKKSEEMLAAKLRELDSQKFALDQHAIVSATDVEGKIIYVNDKFCEISGYTRNELLGKNHRILKSGEHSKEMYADLWRTIANGRVWQGEIKNLKKEGGYYWVRASIIPFLNEQGKPYQYVSIRTDITENKNFEIALATSEERLQRSQNYANIGTWDWNILTGELFWTERIAPLFGIPEGVEHTTYENFLAAIHPDDRQAVIDAVNACVEHDAPYRIEHRVVWPDGTVRWLHERGAVVRNEDGDAEHMLGVVRDITERKETEEQLHIAKENADLANKAKSEFLASMSHELRTPLNAIIGFSGSMKEEIFGPIGNKKYKEYLNDVQHSGKHLLELINDILDASAIEAGALELHEEEVNLADIIDASVSLIRTLADDGKVNVTTSLDPNVPLIYVDQRRVKQILLNLLSNAVKFTAEGGEVYVTSWFNDDGSIDIVVDDSGIGMSSDEIEKALSQFGQVDGAFNRKHSGTGLGLPLTKGLMELHGGTLTIKSKKGTGSTVTVSFPKERVLRKV